MPLVGEDRLIPLKARAWLDLGERHARGEHVDSRNIRKHANDVLRLSRLLAPDTRIPVAARIAEDLNRFLDGIERSFHRSEGPEHHSSVRVGERIEEIPWTPDLTGSVAACLILGTT